MLWLCIPAHLAHDAARLCCCQAWSIRVQLIIGPDSGISYTTDKEESVSDPAARLSVPL